MNVSIITPTFERQQHLKLLYKVIQSQKFDGNWEWLILDDSHHRDPYFDNLPHVKYIYSQERLNVGQKRDILSKQASFDFIAHFDDDDYYAPHYLSFVAAQLKECDFFSFSSWFCFANKQFFYWDMENTVPYFFILNSVGEVLLNSETNKKNESQTKGFGFSYAYKKKILREVSFSPLKFGEDFDFFKKVESKGYLIKQQPDLRGLCLKMQHDMNLSSLFPQYRIPNFIGEDLFPDLKNYLLELLNESYPT